MIHETYKIHECAFCGKPEVFPKLNVTVMGEDVPGLSICEDCDEEYFDEDKNLLPEGTEKLIERFNNNK